MNNGIRQNLNDGKSFKDSPKFKMSLVCFISTIAMIGFIIGSTQTLFKEFSTNSLTETSDDISNFIHDQNIPISAIENENNTVHKNDLSLRPHLIYPNNRGKNLIKGPSLDSEHKFLYCGIAKNSCTVWRRLFYAIQQHIIDRTNVPTLGIYKILEHSMKQQKYMTIVTNEKYRKLVIIRDPLERLLSGFLEKCIGKATRGYCAGDPTTDFTIFANRIISKMKSNEFINGHFMSQHKWCNLLETFKYYTDVIVYSYESIGHDTFSFLKSMGMEQYFYHWGKYQNLTLFSADVHVTYDVKDPIVFYRKYYTKDLAMKCVNAFQMDYELFNLSIPQWIGYLN